MPAQLERQLHLFERPQHAQVAGVAARGSVDLRKAVELEHGDVPSLKLPCCEEYRHSDYGAPRPRRDGLVGDW